MSSVRVRCLSFGKLSVRDFQDEVSGVATEPWDRSWGCTKREGCEPVASIRLGLASASCQPERRGQSS